MQGIKIQADPDAGCCQEDDKPPASFAAGFYFLGRYFFLLERFCYFMFLARFSHRCNKVVSVHRFKIQSSPFRVTLLWLTLGEQGAP